MNTQANKTGFAHILLLVLLLVGVIVAAGLYFATRTGTKAKMTYNFPTNSTQVPQVKKQSDLATMSGYLNSADFNQIDTSLDAIAKTSTSF